MRPIRVLHVTDEVASNNFLNTLTDSTDPAEIDYSFLTFGKPGPFVEALAARGRRTFALDASSFAAAMTALSRVLKDEQPDIINTHLFKPTLATVSLGQKRRVVLTRHHSDAHHTLTPPFKRAFYLRLEHYINKRVDHIVAPSRMVRDVLVDWERVPADKVTVIPYGQNPARFDAITPAALPNRRSLTLVCVSRLFHRKGHAYLLDAFAQLNLDATLYLVGTGEHRPQLEALASQLGIADRVEFLGWRSDALQIIAAADVLVHPSLEDALSQALIEALMLGIPIVATDISGARDTLGDGRFGTLVPPADANAFRDALRGVIAGLSAARARAAEGRAYLLEYMSASRVAAAYAAVYRAIMNAAR